MTVENISLSISMKVWDKSGIKLMIPGSTISLATDCPMGPSDKPLVVYKFWQCDVMMAVIMLRIYGRNLAFSCNEQK